MDKENMVYIHKGILFRHKQEGNHVVCKKMDGTETIMLSNPASRRQLSCFFSYMEGFFLKKGHESERRM
jgi:hypothetical protein